MKFRCERDTLADAVATAQRAVASRTGALPVLSGLRVSRSRGRLELVGHRPRAHDPGAGAGRQRRRGQRGRPGAAVLGDRAPARRRHGDRRARRRRRPDRGRPLRHHAAHAVGRGVPAAARAGRGRRAGRRRRRSPRRCARWCRRRRATTPARSSPGCCSPRPPAACGWSRPTRTGSRCATSRA